MDPARTITDLEREAIHLVLHVRQDEEEGSTIVSLIKEFARILIDHEGDRTRDELSDQLWSQGHSFMVYGAENSTKPVKEFLAGAISRIEMLKKALLCEFTNIILSDPWLATGLVWEKATLDKYQAELVANELPRVEEIPHMFAKKVITWLAKIPLEGGFQVVPYVGGNKELKLKKYEKMIGQLRCIRMFTAVNRVLETKLNETIARRDQDLARWEQSTFQQTAEIRRGLNNVITQCKETETLLNDRNNETQAILGVVRNDLARANSQVTELQAQVAYAWACIHSQQAQINDLNNQDSGCSIM